MFKITEEKFRAYMKCSELYNFKGNVDLDLKTAMLEFAYITLIMDKFENKHLDTKMLIAKSVSGLTKFIPKDTPPGLHAELKRQVVVALHEMLSILDFERWLILSGPFQIPVVIADSWVVLNVSSVCKRFRSADFTPDAGPQISAVTFSPYTGERDMTVDPLQKLKGQAIAKSNLSENALSMNVRKVRLNIFNLSTGTLQYTNIDITNTLSRQEEAYYTNVVNNIKAGSHQPLVPCAYACEFKNICGKPKERNK